MGECRASKIQGIPRQIVESIGGATRMKTMPEIGVLLSSGFVLGLWHN